MALVVEFLKVETEVETDTDAGKVTVDLSLQGDMLILVRYTDQTTGRPVAERTFQGSDALALRDQIVAAGRRILRAREGRDELKKLIGGEPIVIE